MNDHETRIRQLEQRVADLERLLRTNGKTISEMADAKGYLLELGEHKPAVPAPFEQFWKAYPRKIGKAQAEKVWKRLKNKPAIGAILAAIAKQKGSEQWTRDGGQYIPHPATWLNQGRWDDELPMEMPARSGARFSQEQPVRRQMQL